MKVMECKKIAIWGVGKCMEDYYPKIKNNFCIQCFVDNATQKNGLKYTEDQIMCISYDMLKNYDIEEVLIAVYSSKEVDAIKYQLKGLGIEGCHIIDAYIDITYKRERAFIDNEGIGCRPVKHITENDTIKKIICLNIPTKVCNFRCDYCYMFQYEGKNVFDDGNRRLAHTPEYIAYALRQERLGGSCFIDICASGETLLVDKIVDLVYLLVQDGHIIRIVTNGVITKGIEELLNLPSDLSENIIFAVSVHYLELIKRNLLDVFFENLLKIKNSKASLTMNLVGSDTYYPYIEEIMSMFQNKLGVLPQVDMSRDDTDNANPKLATKFSKEEYFRTWEKFDSQKFEHRKKYGFYKIRGKCLAGKKYFYINLSTGEINPCVQSGIKISNLYDNLDRDFASECIQKCPVSWCVNSIYVVPFGLVEGEEDELGFGDRYNRKDFSGNEFIKPKILKIINQKLISG